MVKHKPRFERISTSDSKGRCWHCGMPSNHKIDESDGSEIICCKSCFKNRGKIMRTK